MAGETPWLSVILPVYQGAAYLEHTLASIKRENAEGVEVIAVDDGSTDASIAILERWQAELQLRILRGARVGNWVAATNRALEVAGGTWISLLHQDDAWMPGRIKILRSLADANPDVEMFVHPAVLVDDAGRKIGVWRCPLPARRALDAGYVLPRLIIQNFIPICAPLFLRSKAQAAGPMNEALWYFADWDYWLRLASISRILYVPEPMAAFRIHAASQTARRTRDVADVARQFDEVTRSALQSAAFPAHRRAEALRMTRFAAAAYAFMLATIHRQPRPWKALIASALQVGPLGWWRYVNYSSLWDRLWPRLKLGRIWSAS